MGPQLKSLRYTHARQLKTPAHSCTHPAAFVLPPPRSQHQGGRAVRWGHRLRREGLRLGLSAEVDLDAEQRIPALAWQQPDAQRRIDPVPERPPRSRRTYLPRGASAGRALRENWARAERELS